MKLNFPTIPQEPEPKGKRTVRGNIYGNLVGYIGGKRWKEFGDRWNKANQDDAEEWRKQEERK